MLPPVLVLTAGLGTRLQPLSALRAKPAVPVAGTPLILRVLRWLERAGAKDTILNLHHRPETLTRTVGDGRAAGVRVRYSWEQPLLGSGGGPRRAFSLVDSDDLIVVNGDTLTDVDLVSLWRSHRSSGALVTMALIENPRPDRYGGVLVDRGVVKGFASRGAVGVGWHFVGVQCVRRAAFAEVEEGVPAESVRSVYPALMRRSPGSVRAWTTTARFEDVGTPATYLQTCLERAAAEGAALIDPTARVARSARVERSVLWEGAVVDDQAELVESIVVDGARVPKGSRYHRSVIVQAGRVPPAAGDRLDGSLVVTPIDSQR